MSQDIEIIQGNSLRVNLSVVDELGQSVDLSAAEFLTWQAKSSATSAPFIEKTTQLNSFTFNGGYCYFDINSVESDVTAGKYKHELMLTTYDGEVYTVIQGTLTVLKSII